MLVFRSLVCSCRGNRSLVPLSQVSDELVLPKKIKAGKYVLSWCGPAYTCVYYYYVWAGYVRANANCRIAEFIYKATHIYEFARILMAFLIGLGGHNSTKSILALAHALATIVALAHRATNRTDHGWRNSRDFLSLQLTPHSRELSLNFHFGHDSSFDARRRRWDCEETAQIWANCADVTIVA